MKIKRQSKIIDLIENNEIETQEELAELLRQEGYEVTQATISRDIKELKLIKVPISDEKSKYAIIQSGNSNLSQKYIEILKNTIVHTDYANNIVVIKTLTGMANAAAEALDSLEIKDIVGTIAGDNTIFILTRTQEKAVEFIEHFRKIIQID